MIARWCPDCRDYRPSDHVHEFPPSLFDVPPEQLARTEDPDTSHLAAKALGGRAGTMRRRILEVYRDGEYIAEEAAALAGYDPGDGAWKRVSDLKNLGLIEVTGRTRTASSGREQNVLRITVLGAEVL